jgi:hypothetical protein
MRVTGGDAEPFGGLRLDKQRDDRVDVLLPGCRTDREPSRAAADDFVLKALKNGVGGRVEDRGEGVRALLPVKRRRALPLEQSLVVDGLHEQPVHVGGHDATAYAHSAISESSGMTSRIVIVDRIDRCLAAPASRRWPALVCRCWPWPRA